MLTARHHSLAGARPTGHAARGPTARFEGGGRRGSTYVSARRPTTCRAESLAVLGHASRACHGRPGASRPEGYSLQDDCSCPTGARGRARRARASIPTRAVSGAAAGQRHAGTPDVLGGGMGDEGGRRQERPRGGSARLTGSTDGHGSIRAAAPGALRRWHEPARANQGEEGITGGGVSTGFRASRIWDQGGERRPCARRARLELPLGAGHERRIGRGGRPGKRHWPAPRRRGDERLEASRSNRFAFGGRGGRQGWARGGYGSIVALGAIPGATVWAAPC